MENELHILYGCDDNYAQYAGVSMISLFENNRAAKKIVVYLAGTDISEDNLKKFKLTAESFGRDIVFLDTEKAMEQIKHYGCKEWNGSAAAWLRFFVLDQIPAGVEKLLWLDSDTIVKADLRPLFSMDISGYPVACVCDSICYFSRKRLVLSKKDPYFNSGVILFNLAVWREKKIISRYMKRLETYVEYYVVPDQDLLNDFFRGNIYRLPVRYNLQVTHLAYSVKDYLKVFPWEPDAYYTAQELEAAAKDPAIIHFFRFLGDYPWEQGDNLHPDRAIYEEYKNRSIWKEHAGPLCREKRLFKVEKKLYKALPPRAFLRIFSLVKLYGNVCAKKIPRERDDSMLYCNIV